MTIAISRIEVITIRIKEILIVEIRFIIFIWMKKYIVTAPVSKISA